MAKRSKKQNRPEPAPRSAKKHTKRTATRPPEPRTPPQPEKTPAVSEKAPPTASALASKLFDGWKSGTQIHKLAADNSLKRSKVRRLLIQAAGGKAAFKALRQTGAGGTVEAFGGKRATPRTKEAISADDANVPRITSMRKSEGWSTRRVYRPKNVAIKDVGTVVWRELDAEIHIGPDGAEYVRCAAGEKADLIREMTDLQVAGIDMPPLRLRRFDGSSVARKMHRAEKEIERGEIAIERTRKAKRERKQRRGKKDQPSSEE